MWRQNKTNDETISKEKWTVYGEVGSKHFQVQKDTTKYNTEDKDAFSECESSFNVDSN